MRTRELMMMAVALLPAALSAQQRYMTRTGEITFSSETKMENIHAVNHKATSVFEPSSGTIEFAVLMKAFEFEKALMQEHFNENYVESDKFPKATFKGRVTGLPDGALGTPGSHDVLVEGELTIHGVTRPVKEKARFDVGPKGEVKAVCDFEVHPEDHDIKIPGMVRDNIAQMIQVKVRIDYQKM